MSLTSYRRPPAGAFDFDGLEYPVTVSTAADTIAYSRTNTHRISATGPKNGRTTLRESLAVSPDGQTLTATYSIYRGERILASGIAIFEKGKPN